MSASPSNLTIEGSAEESDDPQTLDDYLGLLDQSLAAVRLIVFHGASGSGKSSQIALLLASHGELQQRRVTHATPTNIAGGSHDVLVIDEIQTLADCHCLRPALKTSRLLLLASHVQPALLWPWRIGRVHRCFQLDTIAHKLAREMTRRHVRFSSAALTRFVARFGANYTDLDIVLEHAGSDDLDHALALFERGSAIRHS